MKQNKTSYILILIALTLLLMGLLAYVAYIDAQRAMQHPVVIWGSNGDFIVLAGIIALLVAVVIVGVKLQRLFERVEGTSLQFEPLSFNQRIDKELLLSYLQHTIPRPFSAALFEPLYRGIMPKSIKVMLALFIPLILMMLISLGALFYKIMKEDRQLNNELVLMVQGQIVEVTPHRSRNGNYLSYHYRYEVEEKPYEAKSYADKALHAVQEWVWIEYLAKDPAVSRIKGMRTTPLDLNMLFIMIGIVSFVLLPGIFFYFYYRKKWLKSLLCEGDVLRAKITSLRKGGRGTIFAKVTFEHHGKRITKRLAYPIQPSLYEVLYNRHKLQSPVIVLVHPTRFYMYLIEPHLN